MYSAHVSATLASKLPVITIVNISGLSNFGDFATLSLPQIKFVFILTIYGNCVEMKN